MSLSVGCGERSTAVEQVISGRTMGTSYTVKFAPFPDMPPAVRLYKEIQEELDGVNDQMSTYLESSEISRFNRYDEDAWFDVSPATARVVDQALEISRLSEGAFDVTVAPLVELWGFGPGPRPTAIPTQARIDELLEWTGYERLKARLDPPALRKTDPRTQVDLSAIAKGHGVDRVARLLDERRCPAYFIEIGGEVRVRGTRRDGQPWQVGIERPVSDVRELQYILGLSDQALATSGDYRNAFDLEGRHFSHTIDPRSGWPVDDPLALVSAVAESCELADAIATSVMAAGAERGLELAERQGWAVLLVLGEAQDYEARRSSAFERLFPDLQPVPP